MPGRDLTRDRLAMRQHARQARCTHPEAVTVDLSTGERVAWLCPDCDAQLPPGYWLPIADLMDRKASR